jgi:hypothetical protein
LKSCCIKINLSYKKQVKMRPFQAIGFFFIVCTAGCGEKALSPEEQRRNAESSIGMTASLVAGFHVDAERACTIAGTPRIEQCAKNWGTLLDEKAARISASMSMEQTQRYFDKCVGPFGAPYCNDLLARAIQIERRKPVSGEPAPQNSDESAQ